MRQRSLTVREVSSNTLGAMGMDCRQSAMSVVHVATDMHICLRQVMLHPPFEIGHRRFSVQRFGRGRFHPAFKFDLGSAVHLPMFGQCGAVVGG